jgi:RimJ/RimL family protein N-acetyltransferase
LVGEIMAYRAQLPPGVFGIGIGIFDESDRGRGFGTEAVALLVRHLFETWGRSPGRGRHRD